MIKSSKLQIPSSREAPNLEVQQDGLAWRLKRQRTAALQDAVAMERMLLLPRGLGVRLSSAAFVADAVRVKRCDSPCGSCYAFGVWDLVFGISLELGAWDLELLK
jgi:hypothetical protein